MAGRHGVHVSSVPFERRYRPPDRRRRRERRTATDRLVCAVCGALLGVVLWTLGYGLLIGIALKAAARQPPGLNAAADPLEKLPPFWWGGPAALGFGLFGAIVGEERMMDAFEAGLRTEGEVARAMNRS